jgi:hypothetical protein
MKTEAVPLHDLCNVECYLTLGKGGSRTGKVIPNTRIKFKSIEAETTNQSFRTLNWYQTTQEPDVVREWLELLRIPEIPGSTFGRRQNVQSEVFGSFPQYLHVHARILP